MIDINWHRDGRNIDVKKYLVDPQSDKHSRRKAFLAGWTRFLNNGGSDYLPKVTWAGLGMVFASILGDIPLEQRKDLYWQLLNQFMASYRISHWTEEQCREILRLVEER